MALKQIAVTNALLSKKAKVEARREQISNEVNRLVAERRYIESKVSFLDNLMRSRGHDLPNESRAPQTESAQAPEAPRAADAPSALPPTPAPPMEPSAPLPPPPRRREDSINAALVAALRDRYAEKDFSTQDLLTLMNELDGEEEYAFDTAWRLCNEFLHKKIIRISSRRMTEKGMVRRFLAVK